MNTLNLPVLPSRQLLQSRQAPSLVNTDGTHNACASTTDEAFDQVVRRFSHVRKLDEEDMAGMVRDIDPIGRRVVVGHAGLVLEEENLGVGEARSMYDALNATAPDEGANLGQIPCRFQTSDLDSTDLGN